MDERSPTDGSAGRAEQDTGQKPVKSVFGLPVGMFVKGGTPTAASEAAIAAEERDAEARRDVAAKEREVASVPIEHGGGMIYTSRMTDTPEVAQAYVDLHFVTERGEPVCHPDGTPLRCLADVIVGLDPLKPTELTLVVACPNCRKRGLPQGQAQMRVRQSNRSWHLDTRNAGELIVFDDGTGPKPYRSAGRVMESEPFPCGQCDFRWRIDNNKIRPA